MSSARFARAVRGLASLARAGASLCSAVRGALGFASRGAGGAARRKFRRSVSGNRSHGRA